MDEHSGSSDRKRPLPNDPDSVMSGIEDEVKRFAIANNFDDDDSDDAPTITENPWARYTRPHDRAYRPPASTETALIDAPASTAPAHPQPPAEDMTQMCD